jgi:hypothetical protein
VVDEDSCFFKFVDREDGEDVRKAVEVEVCKFNVTVRYKAIAQREGNQLKIG